MDKITIKLTVRATTRTGYIVTSSNFTKWRPHLGTRYVDISMARQIGQIEVCNL